MQSEIQTKHVGLQTQFLGFGLEVIGLLLHLRVAVHGELVGDYHFAAVHLGLGITHQGTVHLVVSVVAVRVTHPAALIAIAGIHVFPKICIDARLVYFPELHSLGFAHDHFLHDPRQESMREVHLQNADVLEHEGYLGRGTSDELRHIHLMQDRVIVLEIGNASLKLRQVEETGEVTD